MTLELEMTQEQFDAAMKDFQVQFTERLMAEVVRRAPVGANAFLKNTIMSKQVGDDSVITGPQYAFYVEYGTGPRGESGSNLGGFPPYKAIAAWAKKKGLVPLPKQTFEQMCLNIARSIRLHGTYPSRFIRTAIHQDVPRFAPALLAQVLAKHAKK
jgi:hypothetical protein